MHCSGPAQCSVLQPSRRFQWRTHNWAIAVLIATLSCRWLRSVVYQRIWAASEDSITNLPKPSDMLKIGFKGVLEELDGWIRHKLRTLLWRQWKRNHTRAQNLMRAGLSEAGAWQSATNGRDPWWNGGASHMNAAYPKSWFDTTWAGFAAGYSAALLAGFMNRRMRNRTSGGVGGRWGNPRPTRSSTASTQESRPLPLVHDSFIGSQRAVR
jgi:Group II intron, maturase-specific domain